MKRIIMLIGMLAVLVPIFSSVIDGYAFLEGETDHSGIEVFLQRVAPDTLFKDTVFTNSAGYYSSNVENGWFDITYSKSGFISSDTSDVSLYSDQTLPSKTLEMQGLSGSISGSITEGTYTVTGDLTVQNGDTLIIEPGVILEFNTGTSFLIYGYLKAIGSTEDQIYFNSKLDNWHEMTLFSSSAVVLEYCSFNNTNSAALRIETTNITISNITISTFGNGIIIDSNDNTQTICFDTINIEGCGTNYGIAILNNSQNIVIENLKLNNFNCGVYIAPIEHIIDLIIENSIISNVTEGIYISDMTTYLSLFNAVITSSDYGIYIWGDAYAYIYNSCIYGESSSSYGVYDGYNCVKAIENSNVYGFTENYYDCGDYIGIIVTTNANGDPCDAYGNLSMNPMLDNNLRLQSGSPCIDAGTNTIDGYEFPIGDLDGNYRIWDGDGNGSVVVDMGAYEYDSHSTSIDPDPSGTIDSYSLEQNYPNPFNPETTISYSIPNAAQVQMNVYNIQGQLVEALVNSKMDKGSHTVNFNASDQTTGMYIYELRVDGVSVESRKMMLVK